ncbi:hypothetical protein R1sor_022730 [Riccia sorocarpa]|uniref:Uncharacterized protein n=1 Tax=Riccia sorocarpa TaxID=122646 RepID=A0ABD3GRM0_9MARC
MGFFGFGGGKKKQEEEQKQQAAKVNEKEGNVAEKYADKQVMVEETKGGSTQEVTRLPELPSGPTATDVSVFEFGTAVENDDKVTLAGYCPVSDEMEPCRLELRRNCKRYPRAIPFVGFSYCYLLTLW